MLKAYVYVTLKKSVLDPQGKTVAKALETLGFNEVNDVRIGKYLVLTLDTNNQEVAKERVNEMCERLLANTVIEEYSFELKEE